jgi:hypothetical protein
MVYKTISTEVDVDIDLSDFDTEDLIEELESRGTGVDSFGDGTEVLQTIYQKRRLGKDYQQELDELIWLGLGKII